MHCAIQKKFGDVFSWKSGLPCSIKYLGNFVDLFIICHIFYTLSVTFEQNTRKFIVYLGNLSGNSNFLFLFFMFGDIVLGAQCLSTSTYIQFSMWMRFCCDHAQKFYWDEGMPGEQPPCKKRGISVLFFL